MEVCTRKLINYLEVHEDDVVEDCCVIWKMTLQELYPLDLDHVLGAEVLIQCSDPGPLSPRPRLLRSLAVRLHSVHTVVIRGSEAQQHTQLFPLVTGRDTL